MNKQIKELIEQAGFEEKDGHISIQGVYMFNTTRMEKFAELLIRECIQNIRDNMEYAKVDTDGDKELFLETLRTSGHFYITELKAHFGVE